MSLAVFLICIICLNTLTILSNFQDQNFLAKKKIDQNTNHDDLLTSDLSFFYPPFNYTKISNFFKTNYISDLDFEAETYYRYGDIDGDILNDSVFSLDNLLLYNTLLSDELSSTEIFEKYLQLKSSELWYQGNMSNFAYGFIQSIKNSTGTRFNRRNLIVNVMPIFLLINQLGDELTTLTVDSTTPEAQIELVFDLINSSIFWDETNDGFKDYNSSTGTKYTLSNFYGILANLLVSRTASLDSSIRNRALDLANKTMLSLLNNMWEPNIGFSYSSDNDWTNPIRLKYLDVNALGLSALLEFWLEDELANDSVYLGYVEDLYEKMETELWNPTVNAYEYYRDASWAAGDDTIDLEANTLMMNALLRFFELTGNQTYHSKAMVLFNTFETSFYDDSIGAYNFSISDPAIPADGNKNFYANLKLCESYINAIDIYEQSSLISEYNSSSTLPEFKFNSDTLVLKSNYSFVSNYESSGIENENISYILRYPNETIIEILHYNTDINGTHTFAYNITDHLPINEGYSIIIYARSDYFKMRSTVEYFNVISGVELISGLDEIDSLYQGQSTNLTLVLNNTRSEILNLSLAIEGIEILSNQIDVSLKASNTSNININFTVKSDAIVGPTELHVILKNNSIIYFDYVKIVNIENSLQYSNLVYQSEVVGEDILRLSMKLTNFLPNNSQTINISFQGEFINFYREEISLNAEEVKNVNFFLNTTETTYKSEFNLTMSISKGNTNFYNEILEIEIIPAFEIISYSFPESVPQGSFASFILKVKNNKEDSVDFRFYVNGIRVHINNDEFLPGENTIRYQVQPTINPYDFISKPYSFILRDSEGKMIHRFYFEIPPQLSMLNLLLFYVLPISIPIAIILIYKNKDIKNKMLNR